MIKTIWIGDKRNIPVVSSYYVWNKTPTPFKNCRSVRFNIDTGWLLCLLKYSMCQKYILKHFFLSILTWLFNLTRFMLWPEQLKQSKKYNIKVSKLNNFNCEGKQNKK